MSILVLFDFCFFSFSQVFFHDLITHTKFTYIAAPNSNMFIFIHHHGSIENRVMIDDVTDYLRIEYLIPTYKILMIL